jgi:aerobic carbon-monoxide dehydrogenase large subunit
MSTASASKTMAELAFAAYNNVPPGMEPGLEAVSYYDPPNMTHPFCAYVCVVDIDVDTGVTEIRASMRSTIAARASIR